MSTKEVKHEFLVHLHVQGEKKNKNNALLSTKMSFKNSLRNKTDCITNNEKAKKVPLVGKSLVPPELAQVCYCWLLLLVHQLN